MKDNFSKQAYLYAKYRPDYPQELFDFILSHVAHKNTAWDCATGNGQTAKVLARHFEKVFATDISQKQLDHAFPASNIFYSLQPAEQTDFPGNSFDLITVSQALHWFQFDKFYPEVKRVMRPGGWIATWMYDRIISPETDAIIREFYTTVVGRYWDKERKHVDAQYQTIPFPFEEIECPPFEIQFDWSLADLQGYLNTWSAVQKFIEENGYNPVGTVIKNIETVWKREKMKVIFPITLKMGQVKI